MVFEIGTAERAEPCLRAKLERGERLIGFGHRIEQQRLNRLIRPQSVYVGERHRQYGTRV